jgi:hypothetical protein
VRSGPPDSIGYRKRSSSSGEQALPVSSNKTKSTKQKSAQPVSVRHFIAPLRSQNMVKAEDKAEPATSTDQAARPVSWGKSCSLAPIIFTSSVNLLSFQNDD